MHSRRAVTGDTPNSLARPVATRSSQGSDSQIRPIIGTAARVRGARNRPAAVAEGDGYPTDSSIPTSPIVRNFRYRASIRDGESIALESTLARELAFVLSHTIHHNATIRGMVVKYNAAVMGKNWIHLQDGSGDAKLGTNDVTVTSLDATAKGATVTITGIVRADKDFGSGYSYAIIIEDAKVVKK